MHEYVYILYLTHRGDVSSANNLVAQAVIIMLYIYVYRIAKGFALLSQSLRGSIKKHARKISALIV